MTRTWWLAVLILGTLVLVPNVQGQTKKISYAITELSPLVSGDTSWVRGINNSGQVVGYVNSGGTRNPCIWEPDDNGGWVINIITAVGIAQGINEAGAVVGHMGSSATRGEPFFYDDRNGIVNLPAPEHFFGFAPSGMNYFGDVCGVAFPDDSPLPDAIRSAVHWERNGDGTWTFTDLGEMGNFYRSRAAGMNDVGQVVGSVWYAADDGDYACLWERDENGEWTFIQLGDSGSSALGINNSGQIVGTHRIVGSNNPHACIWEANEDGQWIMRHLEGIELYDGSQAFGNNELGQVVGNRNYSTPAVAFVYSEGMMHNPNDFLPAAASGWSLSSGQDINDYGLVVGGGRNPAGVYRAYLMDTRAVTYSYTSTAMSVSIKDRSTASQAMTLSDNATITDLNVKVTLYHTRYTDLKFELIGPDNVTRLLCNAGAVTGSGTKTLVFDDEGAVGTIIPPGNVLSLYDGTSTVGKWTLKITDTVKNRKTGSFTSFTLDVVPVMPAL